MFNNLNNSLFNAISGATGNFQFPTLNNTPAGSFGQNQSMVPQQNQNISAADVYAGMYVPGQQSMVPQPSSNIDGINPVPTTTPAPAPQNTGMILSSTAPRQEFNSYQTRLDALMNQPDPFTPMYDQLRTLNQTNQDNAIASATTASARQKFQEEQSGRQYQAGLATAGQQTGTSRYLPEYQLGLMESARNSTNDRIMQIDQAEKMAIAKAQQARIEGDVAVLKEQLNQVNELRKEKIRSLERAQEMEWDIKKFQQQMAFDREKFNYSKSQGGGSSKVNKLSKTELINELSASIKGGSIPVKKGNKQTYWIDDKGFMTAAGYQSISEYATNNGVSGTDLLEAFKEYFPTKKKILKNNYGMSQSEIDSILN